MSSTETPSHAAAATTQEEVSESAEAIADRILGNTLPSYEMAPLSNGQEAPTSTGTTFLPEVDTSDTTAPTAPAVTNAEPGAAPAPISEAMNSTGPVNNDIGTTPVSPSDILSRALVITIIIPSTDSRHRYVLDDAYLAKRAVSPPESVITNMSVYTLKELIWRDWRSEWEQRPTSPSSIRLIHMGRMLQDNSYLRDNRFAVGETPHVVHMNVRPEITEEDDGGKIGKTSSRRNTPGEERTPGCRCTLM